MNIEKNKSIPALLKKNKAIEKSRNNWKEKNHDRYDEIKALKARKGEVEISRDNWKESSKEKSQEISLKDALIKALEEQLVMANVNAEQIQKELEDFKKKLEKAPIF